MKIGLVGGVFDPEFEKRRSTFLSVPEVLLDNLLREGGHDVQTFPLSSAPRSNVDLFHVHHFGAAALHLCLTDKRRRVIFTSHNPFIASRYLSNGTGNHHIFRTLFAAVLHNSEGIVALSQAEARVFQEDFKVPVEKIRIIHNGLPLRLYQEFQPEAASYLPLKLLSIGQLEEFKGHIYLLQAMAQVLAERPGCFQLTIISQNPHLLPQLKAFCEQHGIANAVTFESAKSTLELLRYYEGCDIYVQPSLAESFPITIMEAQACGKPVIASQIAGIPEQVLPDSGVLVPPADARALSQALRRLIDNPLERVRMGRAARCHALALYSPERLYAQHIAFYKEVVSRPMQSVSSQYWPYIGVLTIWQRARTFRRKKYLENRG